MFNGTLYNVTYSAITKTNNHIVCQFLLYTKDDKLFQVVPVEPLVVIDRALFLCGNCAESDQNNLLFDLLTEERLLFHCANGAVAKIYREKS